MRTVNRSMTELMKCKSLLQDNVKDLVKSKELLETHLDKLKEEIAASRLM